LRSFPAGNELLKNDLFTLAWAQLWNALQLPAPQGLLAELRERYAEPQRRYHSLQHLAECLSAFATVRGMALYPEEAALALWFHDAVYEIGATDNEACSAAWAQQALRPAGIAEAALARVRELIMATSHNAAPATPDERLVTDIDLAILGAPVGRFEEYERQIREEYAGIADDVFHPARLAVLEGFLARPSIYATAHFRNLLEAQARENLNEAVAQLRRRAQSPSQEG